MQVDAVAAFGVQESDDVYDKPKDVLEDDGFNLPLNFYYEALNSERNMFTSDGIEAVATYERALLGLKRRVGDFGGGSKWHRCL